MAQPNNATAVTPVCVIGSQFMAPCPIEVKVVINSSGDLLITDVNHKILLKVKPCNTHYHRQRVLLDADDNPIAMLQEQILTAHKRWNVFKGDDTDDADMIFSTKTPNIFQSKTNVHVFMANKTSSKDACDFKITGSWSKKNCTIYVGDSSMTIAKINKMQSSEKSNYVKGKFMVKISPNVDYAFVITLIAIVEAMKSKDADVDDEDGDVLGGVLKVATKVIELTTE